MLRLGISSASDTRMMSPTSGAEERGEDGVEEGGATIGFALPGAPVFDVVEI